MAGVVLGLCLAATAHAQTDDPAPTALPASIERPSEASAERRAALRHELQARAAVLEAQSDVVKIVAKLVGPAVVHIEAEMPPESRNRHVEETGSGVIIERKGAFYVLTNCHVVRNAAPPSIRIVLADGRLLHPAKVLEDPETDVAVMAISATELVAAAVGDSDRLQVGDFVLAVGSPFGLRNSVTFGIISAKGRRDLRLGSAGAIRSQDFLQTDASINPGNSGGPLVNLRGEVVGINTAIASDSGVNEGLGFSIPSNMFMTVGRQLIDTGKVARAILGVRLDSNFGPAMAAELGLPRPIGACINKIIPNSPAEAAKLRVGDVVLEFNDTPVEDEGHLVNLVSLSEVGKSVPLVIFRDRKAIRVVVQLADGEKFEK